PRAHLAVYSEIDVALDTFPYHGTTTTCEALSMGVPVVSCVGEGHRSRVASSILRSIEDLDLTCPGADRFADLAVSLASTCAHDPGRFLPPRAPRAFAEDVLETLRDSPLDRGARSEAG
ncbi:MAG: hypothetical protein FJ257_13070, partial [Phycisphaerae bacterium]|nr:hypothetical protein [Phycisphaerae bacterium]